MTIMSERIRPIAVLLALWLLPIGTASAQEAAQRDRELRYDPKAKAWVEVLPPVPGTPEGDLHRIREQIKEEKYRSALKALDRLDKSYGLDHPLRPDALIARAHALMGEGEYYQAHLLCQGFLNRYPGRGLTAEALRLEFVIAETFLGGKKRKLWGMRIIRAEDVGLTILDDISIGSPNDPLAPLAIKTKADFFFRTGDHALAQLEYDRLLRAVARTSPYHRYALRQASDSAEADFAGIHYDEGALLEANDRYREYRLNYPAEADREGVGLILEGNRVRRAEKHLEIARYYERTGHISSAIYYYQVVRRDFPNTPATIKAINRLELLGVLEPVSQAPPGDGSGSSGPDGGGK